MNGIDARPSSDVMVYLAGAVASQHYDVPGTTSRKAWEADATNPNLYHSIENLKDNRMVDHVYDEIKQKTPPHHRDPGKFSIQKRYIHFYVNLFIPIVISI